VTENTHFELKPSVVYLGISIFTHTLTLIFAWFYSANIFISLTLSIVLIVHFYRLSLDIFLKKSDSVQSFTINQKALSTIDKNNKQHQYPYVYCTYQSRFLVIIKTGGRSLAVFKDSLASHSLSQLNRLLKGAIDS